MVSGADQETISGWAMIVFVAALLATVLGITPPKAIEANRWFSAGDYPINAAIQSRGGVTYARVVINPEGMPDSCTAKAINQNVDLAAQACSIINLHARFKPGRDEKGDAVYSVYNKFVNWGVPPKEDEKAFPDIIITFRRFPQNVGISTAASATVMVEPDLRVSSCLLTGLSSGPAALEKVICDQVKINWHPLPVKGADGRATRYVQNVYIGFDADNAHAQNP